MKYNSALKTMDAYKLITDNATDAYFLVNQKGRIVYVNKSTCDLLLFKPEELINKNIKRIVSELNKKKYTGLFTNTRQGFNFPFETIIKRKDEETIMVELQTTNIRMKDEIFVFMSAHDITKRKISEEKINQLLRITENQRRQLDLIIDNVPGMVWMTSGKAVAQTHKFVFVSNHVEKILGFSVSEWLDMPNFLHNIHHEDRERVEKEYANILDQKKSGVIRFRRKRKNSEYIWVESHAKVILDNQGIAVGMCGVLMDISKLKELEERRDEFISIISHELKTPLTSIKGYSQILERMMQKSANSKINRLLLKMNVYVNKLDNLIIDLLQVSKMQSGKLAFNYEKIKFDELVKECVNDIKEIAIGYNIEQHGKTNKIVIADRNRLEQVFANLLANAIKYSPNMNKIIIKVSSNEQHVIVGIQDFGIGVPPEDQKNVFERFYRARNTTRNFSGLGIGLFISSEIIKRHGGHMWVDSKEGEGSTFYFTLPIVSPKLKLP